MTITLFSNMNPSAQGASPPKERLIDGTPDANIKTYFETEDGCVSAGTWHCTKGRWFVRYEEIEYCRILQGEGKIIGKDGTAIAICAGDEFMIPAGFEGEWIVETTMTKRYVVILR